MADPTAPARTPVTDSPPPSVSTLQAVTPRRTRGKSIAMAVTAGILLLVVFVRGGVLLSGPDGLLPGLLPGLRWVETVKTVNHQPVNLGEWRWAEFCLFSDTLLELSIGADTIVDMLGAAALAVLLSVLYGLASLREASSMRYLSRSAQVAVLAVLLAYTYHWCRIDPLGVWTSRGNAWTHLAGRRFSDKELDEIQADAERAPSYFAEGEANYIIADKYKGVPPDSMPSLFEKQKEVRKLKDNLLAKMSEDERKKLVETEYARLLDKKKGGYWPPELAPRRLWVYFAALMETIAIAIWASLLAVVCAIPLSVLAASNTLELIAPGDGPVHQAVRWVGIFVVRRFLDSCRGFNELVMALIFVSIIGLGPFAGILALWVHTTGILGKVFSEAIEAIDPGQVEALVGTGACSAQTISFSVLPQVMPTVVSYSLLRFESNVRSAAILGWVGAGGIGFLLQDKMVGYNHREVCTMMIMIIVAVSLIDFACGKLRRRFI